MKFKVKHISFIFYILMVALMLLSGCRMVKYVPEDRYLLNDVAIKVDNETINREELSTHIRQEENLKILGLFKFHLWLYNLSGKKKEEGWFKRIGEPPMIFDEGLNKKSVKELTQYMYNKGYYHAQVSDSVSLKDKRANVVYNIKSGDPYYIRNLNYIVKDSSISDLILNSSIESLVKKGDIFDVDLLGKERTRIALILQNLGYFKFVEEYIHFKVDSSFNSNEVTIDLIVEKAKYNQSKSLETEHKQYVVGNYQIFIDKQNDDKIKNKQIAYTDTTYYYKFTFFHNGKNPINEDLIMRSIEIKPGNLFKVKDIDKTYNNLYSLRQFKYVNIQYSEEQSSIDSVRGVLTGKIIVPLQVKQNYSVDIEGTNNDANLGVAGNLNYQHRNLFGGAEIFDMTFKGATERQVVGKEKIDFNTIEYGGTAKLSVPGFIFPIDETRLKLYSMPFTSVSFSYNYQERPDYTRTIVNATVGYQWKTKAELTHNFNLFDVNAVQIFRLDPDFENTIKDLYIKSSYTDHIISATSYSRTFNDQGLKKRPDYHFFRMNLETAGNSLWTACTLFGLEKNLPDDVSDKDQTEFYKIFDTRFAQYLKGDFDFRYGYRFDKYNSVATRGFFGIAYPYGNFHVIPFEKRYFTGGANGIRAWQVRSLGPGRYRAGAEEYPNQSADIKLEANIEYRFKILWMFEGALFVDAGNVWAINSTDNREGAVFQFDQFYNEIAVGSGMGLRFVHTYFIIRADVGLKLRDPSQPIGQCWIPTTRSFNKSDLGFNIAIGYPF